MEESIFPHFRSLQSDSAIEEERRLAYVGITRAQQELYLTFATRRTIFGNVQFNPPSRFLRDIAIERLAIPQGARLPTFLKSKQRDMASVPTPTPTPTTSALAQPAPSASVQRASQAAVAAPFRPGEKVRHAVFGQGVVVSCTGSGDEAQVSVAFPNVGIKKLVAGYARLEKV
jgi:DNA helicase II / ATP-dependent DNA helicase PcrA